LRQNEGHEGQVDKCQDRKRSKFSHQQVPTGLEVQVNKPKTNTHMTIAQLNKLAQEIANLLGELDEAALIKVLDFVKEAAEPTAAE
jgi:hypothetical protein